MREELRQGRRQERRKLSVRAGLRRKSNRPRLSVSRSSKHIHAQIVDDAKGHTLAAYSSASKSFRAENQGKTKTEAAQVVGGEVARRALDAGVESVVFDRGGSRYHGRVKALAESARAAGLKF